MGMYVSIPDGKYLQANDSAIISAMMQYKSITGKKWPSFNREIANQYGSAEAWHKALLDAIAEAEAEKQKAE